MRYAFPHYGRLRFSQQEDVGEVVVTPKPIRHSVSFAALFCLALVSICLICEDLAAAGAN
jgi:hypothetical protein